MKDARKSDPSSDGIMAFGHSHPGAITVMGRGHSLTYWHIFLLLDFVLQQKRWSSSDVEMGKEDVDHSVYNESIRHCG